MQERLEISESDRRFAKASSNSLEISRHSSNWMMCLIGGVSFDTKIICVLRERLDICKSNKRFAIASSDFLEISRHSLNLIICLIDGTLTKFDFLNDTS